MISKKAFELKKDGSPKNLCICRTPWLIENYEEAKKRIAEKQKGKQMSEESRRKMSESWNYDKIFTEETRKKISESNKGKHWFNNGSKSIKAKTCPEGFVPGRLLNKNKK